MKPIQPLVAATEHQFMRVRLIPGEATRFHVEADTTRCPKCNRHWPAERRSAGSMCPKCGAVIEERWHLVDLVEHRLNGYCSCEYFQFVAQPQVVRRPYGSTERFICKHIDIAREFALDVYLGAYQHTRKEPSDD